MVRHGGPEWNCSHVLNNDKKSLSLNEVCYIPRNARFGWRELGFACDAFSISICVTEMMGT